MRLQAIVSLLALVAFHCALSFDECSVYEPLRDADRAQAFWGVTRCDKYLPKFWYRFTGAAGNKMAEKCVPKQQCGTHAPGWLSDGHPTMAQGVVTRKVCFHWSSGCCQWSYNIRVRNCGAFYVYELTPPPACSLRYCGNRGPAAECSNYTVLKENDRAQGYKGVIKCDSALIKTWYRLQGDAGKKLPDKCVPTYQCGTHAPGWLTGGHPTVAQGIVTRKVCFHWSSNCCQLSSIIRVRSCGAFYVYELSKPPGCSLRYCGDGEAASECQSYRTLNEADRAQSYRGVVKCDKSLVKAWYRFTGPAGNKMADSRVAPYYCGTHAPGYLTGGHPTVAQGAVQRTVCFHWSSNNCSWSSIIRVRNCGAFYVYELSKPPACSLRYCGNGVRIQECQSYRTLNETDRAQSYKGVVKCDKSLVKAWYRFTGPAGNKMADSRVAPYYCGTHAPGYLTGGHPTVAQGAVQRKVCFHWSSNNCSWSSFIRVRNCVAFYVYELSKPPACSLRYCGNGVRIQECQSYRTLNETDRAQSYRGVVKCDKTLVKAWYRFTGPAGNKMADSRVAPYYCGTHAPGYLTGGHPTVAQGAVQRTVCFHWSSNNCSWSSIIRVRNCVAFYVYELSKPPACSLRYCGNGVRIQECQSYRTLNEADRAQSYRGSVKCDKTLVKAWYRFTGPAGNKMADSSVAVYYCGTHAPGHLTGGHPTVAQGAVQRKVCFHWSNDDCSWSSIIRVRNCGVFFVYELSKTPACSLRYCGDGK